MVQEIRDDKGRVYRDDDATRPVSTFVPEYKIGASSAQSSNPLLGSTPSVGYQPSTLDTLGLYGAVILLVVALSSITVYLGYSGLLRVIARRWRTPPDTLRTDIDKATTLYQERLQEKTDTSPVINLPNYKDKNAAVRRALIVSSVNPSHYTNYNRGLIDSNDAKLPIEDASLTLAPEDAAQFLSDPNSFNPLKIWYDSSEPDEQTKTRNIIYGFFHPYSNAGGGGERVLWAAVKSTLEHDPRNVAVIYTGYDSRKSPEQASSKSLDVASPDSILRTVSLRFGLNVDTKRVVFIYVPKCHLVNPLTWPRATLVGQGFGSMVLAYEAISRLIPDVFLDTMGYPFVYPLVSNLTNAPIAAYVHYPVISNDMLDAMLKNTDNLGAGSAAPSAPGQSVISSQEIGATPKRKSHIVYRTIKYIYWRLFALAYTFVGSYVSVAVVNSSWTLAHMRKQWYKGHTPSAAVLEGLRKVQETQEAIAAAQKDQALKTEGESSSISVTVSTGATKRVTKIDANALPIAPTSFGNAEAISGKIPEKPVQGSRITVVYPPCATQDLESFPITKPRGRDLVYIAQFRPEKRHELVLREFATFLKKFRENQAKAEAKSRYTELEPPRLVLVGTIRNDDDRNAVYSLRILARELGLKVAEESSTYVETNDGSDVEFVLDAPWSVVIRRLSQATIGINAMWNEHFGMVVVEYMAAGLVPVVHNSGGPMLDIVVPLEIPNGQKALPTGFKFRAPDDPKENYKLGSESDDSSSSSEIENLNDPSKQSLADCLEIAYTLPEKVLEGYRVRARLSSAKFSDAAFAHAWDLRIGVLAKLERRRRNGRVDMGLYY